eukprot:11781986-Prorocentrum_lima.AAC.1
MKQVAEEVVGLLCSLAGAIKATRRGPWKWQSGVLALLAKKLSLCQPQHYSGLIMMPHIGKRAGRLFLQEP